MSYFLLNGSNYIANFKLENNILILSNGLIERKIDIVLCKTISFKNTITDIEFIDSAYCDIDIVGAGESFINGGLEFVELKKAEMLKAVEHKFVDTMTENNPYPPNGVAVDLVYKDKANRIEIVVHYELFSAIPTIKKQIFVKNISKERLIIDNIITDVLNITTNRDKIFIESNYNASENISTLDVNKYAQYFSRFVYDKLEVAPKFRMNVELKVGESLESIIAYEILFIAEYYEHKMIELKAIYRKIAPWCLDSPLFFHLISNRTNAIKKAVNQCAEVGLEMIIQSFGSAVNMESKNKFYLNRIKNAYAYGQSKGLRMGAYTLAYVKNYRPVRGHEALNHDSSHICRCLANDWAVKYIDRILNFIDETNTQAIEIDGPYGMLMCSGGKTHHHADFTDSQYKQWKLAVDYWYKELKKRNVYINAPDWHFLNGINRCPVGYEEIAFSEKRAEQLVVSRIYYYKGTFMKNPSQGWGFVPLNVYHGGGSNAQFFPIEQNEKEFDWALAQIVASGVWPTLRGRKIYDSEIAKQLLQKWINIYKKYRQVINGYTIHFLPPIIDKTNPEKTLKLDAIMNLLPYGENRGFIMVFNQTESTIKQKVLVPLFYSGLTDLSSPPPPFENTKNCDIEYPVYGIEIAPLKIMARDGKSRTFITDAKIVDKEIPALPQSKPTNKSAKFYENGKTLKEYVIDTNGNVEIEIQLKSMTYTWFVIKEN